MLHEGHLEEGMIIDKFLGILYIQTLRNEPTIEPNTKTMIYKIMLCIYQRKSRLSVTVTKFVSSIG
jgi:hypothetical protein